jgi:hypothetical protein
MRHEGNQQVSKEEYKQSGVDKRSHRWVARKYFSEKGAPELSIQGW